VFFFFFLHKNCRYIPCIHDHVLDWGCDKVSKDFQKLGLGFLLPADDRVPDVKCHFGVNLATNRGNRTPKCDGTLICCSQLRSQNQLYSLLSKKAVLYAQYILVRFNATPPLLRALRAFPNYRRPTFLFIIENDSFNYAGIPGVS